MTEQLPWLDSATVHSLLPMADAINTLERALLDGFDPATDPARSAVPTTHGELLLMPSEALDRVGVKLASVAPGNPELGRPRIQAVYVLLDGVTLTPLALMDGTALTSLRTPALSAVAAKSLARPDASTVVVFGTGPQAQFHIEALQLVRPIANVRVIGRHAQRTNTFVSRLADAGLDASVGSVEDIPQADIIVCATSAGSPLFDGSLVSDGACVLAVGSHTPDAAELDSSLIGRSLTVVEDVVTALREGGDIIQAVEAGTIDPTSLVTLLDLVRGQVQVESGRPRVFKSVGMAWEDLVTAAAVHRRWIRRSNQ